MYRYINYAIKTICTQTLSEQKAILDWSHVIYIFAYMYI